MFEIFGISAPRKHVGLLLGQSKMALSFLPEFVSLFHFQCLILLYQIMELAQTPLAAMKQLEIDVSPPVNF